jgi:hypothetical protein
MALLVAGGERRGRLPLETRKILDSVERAK